MWRAIIFDLDDTLYRERDFVESGWRVVSAEIERSYRLSALEVYGKIESIFLHTGRDKTFDRLAACLGVGTSADVQRWIELYRYHSPNIELYDDARFVLERLHPSIRLGVVTDGDPSVQRNKFSALQLRRWIGVARYTWDSGPERQKPHRDAYLPVLSALGVEPRETVYVGDNPYKDFVGARALGMDTVRLRRGPYASAEVGAHLEANRFVDSLSELLAPVLRSASRGAARSGRGRDDDFDGPAQASASAFRTRSTPRPSIKLRPSSLISSRARES